MRFEVRFSGKPPNYVPPEPPDNVPEKFRKRWDELPPCCHRFYTHPGQGCCAGQSEPQPALMDAPAPGAADTVDLRKPDALQATPAAPATERPSIWQRVKRWALGVVDWFRHLLLGFWQDMKRVFSGAKTD